MAVRITARRLLQAALIALVLSAALPLSVSAQPADPDEPPPPPTPPTGPPDHTFGAVETYHTPDVADEANVGWTRILFYWSELKKDGPDTWNEHHVPYWRVDREIEGGREVVGQLQHTPSFATDGIPGAGVPHGLYLPVDDPGNLWAAFVREVVGKYRWRINHWTIWNEPDIPIDVYGTQWEGTAADYYRLVKVAYLVARDVNPDAVIHLAGLTYWHNPAYLSEFLTAASEDPTAPANRYYFDVVSAHIYFKPATTWDIIGSLRTQMADFGIEKPIWINETNAPPYDDPLQAWHDPDFHVTQEMQASFLLQEFAIALSLDVERVSVYKWIDEPPPQQGFEPYGLLRADRSKRPAFYAYDVITTYYSNTQDTLALRRDDLQQIILDRGDLTTRVYWLDSAEDGIVRVPALAEHGQLITQRGEVSTLNPEGGVYEITLEGAPCPHQGECLMGGRPLLVVEETSVDLAEWPRWSAELHSVGRPVRVNLQPASEPNNLPLFTLLAAASLCFLLWVGWILRR